MKKKWIMGGVIVIAAAGAAMAVYHHYQAATDTPPPPPTALVKRGTLTVHVYATGTVQANQKVDIKCQAGGEITKLPFQIGDAVKKGALVLQVDKSLELQALDIANQNLEQAGLNLQTAKLNLKIAQQNLEVSTQTDQANLISAQAQLDNDKKNVQRDLSLLHQGFAAQQTYDNDHTTVINDEQVVHRAKIQIADLKTQVLQVQLQQFNVQLDKLAVKTQQTNVAQANTNLDYCTVKAPFSGVVSNLQVQKGQIIASAISNVGGGTTVMTLVDLSHIFIYTTINESDISRLRIGESAQITAAGVPGKVFRGSVQQISPVSIQDQNQTGDSTTTSNLVTFEAKIEVLGKNKTLLRPGMTANVDIFTDQLKNVLFVPLQAVVIQNGQDTVTLVKADGKMVSQNVRLGQRNDNDWQVLSGLKEGEKVKVDLGGANSMWTPWWYNRH